MDSRPEVPAVTRPARTSLLLLLAVVASSVLALDQASKAMIVARLTENVPVWVIDGWLQLHLVRNPGAAFSLSTGTTWLFTLIATTVIVVIIRVSRRIGSRAWALALGLLLGGALGNLSDRLWREPGFARGHVVDFIEFRQFPLTLFQVFNVADSAIVTSACLIAVLAFREVPLEGRHG